MRRKTDNPLRKRERIPLLSGLDSCLLATLAIVLLLTGCAGQPCACGSARTNERRIADPSWTSFFQEPPLGAPLDLPLLDGERLGGNPGRERPLVIFVGLDGITWKVIRPLMDQGDLPNLQRLCSAGSYGPLATDVALSPVSWNSIMTGMNMEHHGILPEGAWESTYRTKVFHAWDVLARAGWRVGVLDYPYLYERDLPKGALHESTAASIRRRYNAAEYAEFRFEDVNPGDTVHAMLNQDYDACFSLFTFTDVVQHAAYQQFSLAQFAGLQNLSAPDDVLADIGKDAERVRQAYVLSDRILGEVLTLDPDYVFVASDHGFATHNMQMTLTPNAAFFERIGLSVPLDGSVRFPLEFGTKREPVRLQARQFGKILASSCLQIVELPWVSERGDAFKLKVQVDFPRFRFESTPWLSSSRFQELKTRIEECTHDGLPCLRVVEETESMIEFEPSEHAVRSVLAGGNDAWGLTVWKMTGNHFKEDDGVFIMAGRGIRAGHEVSGASLCDLVPTLMYLVGEPVAEDLDGAVLRDAVAGSYLLEHPVPWVATYGRPRSSVKMETRKLAESEVLRLRSLGYIQ